MSDQPFPPEDPKAFLALCAGEWMSLRSSFELSEGDDDWHASEKGELKVSCDQKCEQSVGRLQVVPPSGHTSTLEFSTDGRLAIHGGPDELTGLWRFWPDGSMELTLGVRAHGLAAPDGLDQLYPLGGTAWDLALPLHQQRCRHLVAVLNPVVVHLSPPCTKLSVLGNMPDLSTPEGALAQGLVAFSVDLIARRERAGGAGSLESPKGAKTWKLQCVLSFFGAVDKPNNGGSVKM